MRRPGSIIPFLPVSLYKVYLPLMDWSTESRICGSCRSVRGRQQSLKLNSIFYFLSVQHICATSMLTPQYFRPIATTNEADPWVQTTVTMTIYYHGSCDTSYRCHYSEASYLFSYYYPCCYRNVLSLASRSSKIDQVDSGQSSSDSAPTLKETPPTHYYRGPKRNS